MVVAPRKLSFKNEEEKAQYEQWKRTVLAAATKKPRQSTGGMGVVKKSSTPTSSAPVAASTGAEPAPQA